MATMKQLVESEISDFFAIFGSPGEPVTIEEAQRTLLSRISPLLSTDMDWINCSDRMPPTGGSEQSYVLAADFKNHYWPNLPNTQVGVYGDWFSDGNPTWDDGDGNDLHLKEVTHWMLIPEPPTT